MKAIKYLNTFAIGLPITLLFFAVFFKEALLLVGLSAIITGLTQVIIGLRMLFVNPENRNLRFYSVSVILFFISWFINVQIGYNEFLTYILFPIPIILAVYLSAIVYNTKY
ncbi:hypothetical protein [Flavobacterium sp.]|uniref:hypothetical protein n=1 Tax=Flavobacterium sp. TaxID=239 RepID=UPI004047D220